MNAIELMTKLNVSPVEEWATIAANSGTAGAKDVYLAMGKSHSIPLKDLEADWKAAQPTKAKTGAVGFAGVYYDWLAEGERSEQDARDYIMGVGEYGETTKNVQNHLTHYLNIWALAETVRSGSKVMRSISAGKGTVKAVKANRAVDKGEAPVYEEPEAVPFKELMQVIKDIAKGEYKSKNSAKTVIKGKMAHLTELEHIQIAEKAMELLDEKGKMSDVQAKFIEMMRA